MRLLQCLAELVAPTRCAGCDLPGHLLCPDCRETLARFERPSACPRCGAPFGVLVCTECWETEFAFEAAVALGELARPLSRAVVLHKDAGERRLGAELGALLGATVLSQWPGWADAVTYIPATRAAVARRGFDHAEAIAGGVARACGVPLVEVLVRARARDQRALDRMERAENARSSFSTRGDVPARTLLVDDVFTTGATLDAAASVLSEAGGASVRVAVIARAW